MGDGGRIANSRDAGQRGDVEGADLFRHRDRHAGADDEPGTRGDDLIGCQDTAGVEVGTGWDETFEFGLQRLL